MISKLMDRQTPSLTKADKCLIAVLLLVSLSGIGCHLLYSWRNSPNETEAEIQVNGKPFKTIVLRPGYSQEFRIGGQTEYAIIEVNNGRIRIRQDDSPRQIGVQTGWISKPPQQIVNLPYRIVITILSPQPNQLDAIAH